MIDIYSRLTALRSNIPEKTMFDAIERRYIDEYHSILSTLEQKVGTNLTDFRIPDTDIKPRLTSWNYLTGGDREYSREVYCPKPLFLMKIDALLMKFTLQEKQLKIGFEA